MSELDPQFEIYLFEVMMSLSQICQDRIKVDGVDRRTDRKSQQNC